MIADRPGEDARRREEEALDRLEARVREVQHLHPFEMSRREDGRFVCELTKPPAELTAREARAAAEALEDLASLLRDVAEG